jgi:hypothetical protein
VSGPTNHPLHWPVGWKRTAPYARKSGSFTTKAYSTNRSAEPLTISQAVDRLLAELLRMAVAERDVIISTNIQPTLSGRPRSGERKPDDPGAAVYWKDYGQQRCMAIDRYTDVAQNIAALAATIEAMRAIERHGGALILERAFTGFTALPAPIVAGMKREWRDVMQFTQPGRITADDVRGRYRELASLLHPDKAINETDRVSREKRMAELNVARDEALLEVYR